MKETSWKFIVIWGNADVFEHKQFVNWIFISVKKREKLLSLPFAQDCWCCGGGNVRKNKETQLERKTNKTREARKSDKEEKCKYWDVLRGRGRRNKNELKWLKRQKVLEKTLVFWEDWDELKLSCELSITFNRYKAKVFVFLRNLKVLVEIRKGKWSEWLGTSFPVWIVNLCLDKLLQVRVSMWIWLQTALDRKKLVDYGSMLWLW